MNVVVSRLLFGSILAVPTGAYVSRESKEKKRNSSKLAIIQAKLVLDIPLVNPPKNSRKVKCRIQEMRGKVLGKSSKRRNSPYLTFLHITFMAN